MTAPTRPRRPARPTGVLPVAGRLAARAQAERWGRRRRRARVALLALAAVLPLAGLAWVVLASPWLAVAQVEVSGTARLTPQQVVAAAAVEPGTPLARVDAGAVADRVGALPAVADVRVGRGWPHTLELDVTERQPVAALPHADGVELLDVHGVAFATEPSAPAGVPRLDVDSGEADDAATRAALAVRAELPPSLAAQVGVLRARTPSDVELVLLDGRRVVWGAPGQAATKAAALEVLLGMPGREFDVSAPGVVVRR